MKYVLTILICISCFAGIGQQKKGEIVYLRSVTMIPRLNSGNTTPVIRQNKFNLSFGDDKTLWKQLPDTTAGSADRNDQIYIDHKKNEIVELRTLADKSFIISDNSFCSGWNVTDETKTILGYKCSKATGNRIVNRTSIRMVDGQPQRKDVTDTMKLEAWFTKELPASLGPDLYNKLPGTILELNINGNRITFQAVKIEKEMDMAKIKLPQGQKTVTDAEFNNEAQQAMMQRRPVNN